MSVHTTTRILVLFLLAILCVAHETASAQVSSNRRFVVSRKVLDFGSVPLDSCRSDTVSVVRRDSGRTTISGLAFYPKTTEFAFDGIGQADTLAARRVIRFTYCPDDTLPDAIIAVITFRGAGPEAWSDTVSITGRGRVAAPRPPNVRFDSGPVVGVTSVSFDSVRLGTAARMRLELVNDGTVEAIGRLGFGNGGFVAGPFSIDSVRRQKGEWERTRPDPDTIPVQSVLGVEIRYRPGRLSMDRPDTATLYFKMPGNISRSVLLSGWGAGAVIVTPGPADYGKMGLDTCQLVLLPVRNEGNTPLIVNRLEFDQRFIKLDGPTPKFPDTIGVGRELVYSLRFCLRDTGRLSTTIIVASNAVAGPGQMTVSAEGVRGTLFADPVPLSQVAVGCDTIVAVVRNVGQWRERVAVVGLKRSDRGFVFIDPVNVPTMLGVGETLQIRLRFCPSTRSTAYDTIIVRDMQGGELLIPLSGTAMWGSLVPLRLVSDGVPLERHDFGDVQTGQTRSVKIYLRNTGNLPVVIERSGLTAALLSGSAGTVFTVAPASSGATRLEIGPGKIDSILLGYRPSNAGDDSAQVTVAGEARFEDTSLHASTGLVALGRGVRGSIGERKIRITGGGGSVGDTIRLAVRVTPPIEAWERLTRLELRFNVDATSLVPVDEGDEEIDMQKRAGFWSVTRGGTILEGDTIAEIALIGLSTGIPINRVALLPDPTIDGQSILRLDDTSLVLLDGCGLGRSPRFSIKSKLTGIVIPASADAAAITYRAPAGAVPRLRLVDLDGAARLAAELEPGTDADQTVRIPLNGLGAGVYLVELRVAGDVSVIPIMIAR